ncbi:MAG: beta-lactamase family protein [Clostridia bacterium]|nr:beta-lactamase family protein [Clostridia bacterium]
MSNALFRAVLDEWTPMYDAAVITPQGTEFWRHPSANNANNGHSTTKFFIATAIGILCDRGMLSTDTTIGSVFPDSFKPAGYDPGWEKVTVRDALRHQTGMEEIPFGVDDDETAPLIGEDYLGYVLSLKLTHAPGTFYRYSDAAYYLLSRVIAQVTGETADVFLKKNVFDPLGFRQWAMAKCPQGHPIAGGGFFARADDVAKLGYAYALSGRYEDQQIISERWINAAMENDYACTRFRDTDIYLKTGARGQCVAFSRQRPSAAAWHGCAAPDDKGKRNDRLLSAYCRLLDERYGAV